jgi:translation elongation factor EF-1alpha
MASEKPHMNLAVIGHIDHGKSTAVGRMMFETGAVPAHIIEGYRKEAESPTSDLIPRNFISRLSTARDTGTSSKT